MDGAHKETNRHTDRNITVKLSGINIRKTIQRSIGLKINPETSLSVRLHHKKITQQHGSQLTTMDKSQQYASNKTIKNQNLSIKFSTARTVCMSSVVGFVV